MLHRLGTLPKTPPIPKTSPASDVYGKATLGKGGGGGDVGVVG